MDNFFAGMLSGGILMVVITLFYLERSETTISSKIKLNPDWELVVNGKSVDTIYIYKGRYNEKR